MADFLINSKEIKKSKIAVTIAQSNTKFKSTEENEVREMVLD